ncbi:MAG: MoaD/ThiS family protein [Methanobacterium sp.]
MKVIITDGMGTNTEKEIQTDEISGGELLEKLNINLFEAMIMKNGEIVNESAILTSSDRIKIMNVIHGG